MLDTKEKPVEGNVTEPAKQWRNWYRATEDCLCNKTRYRAGDKIASRYTHPSRDVAETRAARDLARALWHYEYLGAFPVEAS